MNQKQTTAKPAAPAKPNARVEIRPLSARRDARRVRWIGYVLFALLCASLQLQAQFVPGQGFGGFGANQTASRSARRTYPNNGDVGDAVISMAPDSRNLVVIADERTRAYISQVVSNLNLPRPQVLIKVVFLEVTHTDSSDIGIEGGFAGTNQANGAAALLANGFGLSGIHLPASGSNAPSLNVFGQPINSFGSPPPGAGVYQILGQDYQATLRAIAQSGKTKILSRPSILARNNQPATISVGQSVPLITSTRYDTFGNAINSVTYQSVGIILRVTPFITADGLVEMILSPETSELVADRTQWVPISSGANPALAPLIDSRAADTVVVTPDGQTIIIGGLMSTSKGESVSKIPLVGDIPWIGNLFKHKIKTDSKTELIIFLTPHIVSAPSQLASLTEKETGNSEARKGLTEKELDLFLENLPKDESNHDTTHKGKKK